jgi:hypothetical protein
MYEKEISFIIDFAVNQIKFSGSSFTLEKLARSELHPSIIKYLSAEIDSLIEDDKKNLLEKSQFDYSGSAIAKHFERIKTEIKKTHRFSFSEVKKIISHAVTFNSQYVLTPKKALIELIFSSSRSKLVEDIEKAFDYTYYYAYIKDILIAYLSRRKILNISPDDFELILTKIDNELFNSSKKVELVNDALTSIGDFYNQGLSGRAAVSLYMAESFLKEKELEEYIIKLREEFPKDSKQKYDLFEIKNILFSGKIINSEKIKPEEVTEPADEKPDISDEKTAGEELSESDKTSVSGNSSGIIEELIIEEDIPKSEPSVPSEKKSEIKSDEEEIEFDLTEKDKLETLYEFKPVKPNEYERDNEIVIDSKEQEELIGGFEGDLIEDKSDLEIGTKINQDKTDIDDEEEIKFLSDADFRKRKDIFSFLSDKEVEKIISSVFNEDGDDFTTTMESINECASYEEATEILKDLFVSYQVNPYSKEAVILTNAVSNYFEQL